MPCSLGYIFEQQQEFLMKEGIQTIDFAYYFEDITDKRKHPFANCWEVSPKRFKYGDDIKINPLKLPTQFVGKYKTSI